MKLQYFLIISRYTSLFKTKTNSFKQFREREKKIFVPQLQSLLAKFIICYEDIIAILNPEEDWDNNTSHLFNARLSSVELKDFKIQLLSGTKSFTQIKDAIRGIPQTRPFD